MRVSVTGGGGFLGSAIVRMLRERGDEVRALCRGDYPALREAGAEVVRGDLADPVAVERACAGCDAVIHAAALAGIWGRYSDYRRTNVDGTANVIAACRKAGIRRLVYTSSPSVSYGPQGVAGGDESLPYPRKQGSHYSATKAEAERMVMAADGAELRTCSLRPHLIWGPGDNHLAPRLVSRAKAGTLRIVGNGENLIDTIYVDNAARAHLLALDRLGAEGPPAGRIYFLSQGQPIRAREWIDRILASAGLPPVRKRISIGAAVAAGAACELVYSAFRISSEPPMTRFLAHQLSAPHWFDIGAAKRDLGYEPEIDMEEGFRRLAAWFRTAKTAKG
jgi:nucleoside-diphosphate-sugar epimerase